jgi:predicted nucleic acid-binding protein
MRAVKSVMSRSGPPLRTIDASAVVELLMVSDRAAAIEHAIEDARLVAPDSINLEVLQALRGLERSGKITQTRTQEMVTNFVGMPLVRLPTFGLLASTWSLRGNLSAYDACYVALTRRLEAQLITCDRRLSRAPSLGIALIVV